MTPAADQLSQVQRASQRRNMLLAARLETADTAWDVRLRNISETGALVEGSGLPEAGTAIQLRRSAFHIGAAVAWSSGTRCGIAFESAIEVKALVDGVGRVARAAAASPHQGRVDAIQSAVRSGGLAIPPSARLPDAPRGEAEARIAEELGYVQRLLQVLGNALVADRVTLQRHAGPLQNLDLASQLLGQLAAVLTNEDRAAAIAAITNPDLRARLSRRTSR